MPFGWGKSALIDTPAEDLLQVDSQENSPPFTDLESMI